MGQINIGEKIRLRREHLEYSMQDIADKMDVHRSTIMRWENGETSRIKLATIEKLAQILRTSPGHLMGYENLDENDTISRVSSGDDACFLPVLRHLYADDRLYEAENIMNYDLADSRYRYMRCFYLFVPDDSMAPALEDGDRILVKQQDELKDGQVGVFLIDDQPVIRRLYQRECVELQAFNPYYPALKMSKDKWKQTKTIGVVLESKRIW